jgi:hypothetical protein
MSHRLAMPAAAFTEGRMSTHPDNLREYAEKVKAGWRWIETANGHEFVPPLIPLTITTVATSSSDVTVSLKRRHDDGTWSDVPTVTYRAPSSLFAR